MDDASLLEAMGLPAWAVRDLQRLGASCGKMAHEVLRDATVAVLWARRHRRWEAAHDPNLPLDRLPPAGD